MKAWWLDQKEELNTLVAEKCPLYVYNDETLNDTFFDFCCIEGVDKIFYAVSANAHPRILEKVYKLGGGFTCISIHELENLFTVLPQINPLDLLYASDTDQGEGLKRAVEKGVPVILSQLDQLKVWPDILKDKPLYLSINPIQAQKPDPVSRTGPNVSGPDILMSKFKELRHLLKTHQIKIKGIRLRWNGSEMSNKELAAITSFFSDLSGFLIEPLEFILDSGRDISLETEKDGPGAFTMKGRVALIKGLWPKTKIGLGLGEGVISHAGVFLTRVREAFKAEGCHYVFIEKGIKILMYSSLTGVRHRIVNFSKLGEKETVLTHIVGSEVYQDEIICELVHGPPVDPGDVLLITNSGAYGPPTRRGSKKFEFAPYHYLLARKMCPVRV